MATRNVRIRLVRRAIYIYPSGRFAVAVPVKQASVTPG
jgi:hypothetical protein